MRHLTRLGGLQASNVLPKTRRLRFDCRTRSPAADHGPGNREKGSGRAGTTKNRPHRARTEPRPNQDALTLPFTLAEDVAWVPPGSPPQGTPPVR